MTPTEQSVDLAQVIAERNQEAQARREGKAPEKPVEAKTIQKTQEQAEPARVPRSVRRELNHLREEAAELRGKLAAYEELGAVPRGTEALTPKPTEDPEPVRSTFPTQHEYDDAKAEWRARQLAQQEADKLRQEAQEKEAETFWNQIVSENTAKMNQDKEKFEDWADIQEAAMSPDFNVSDQLERLILASELRADVLYYLCTHPEELKALKELEGLILVRNFGRLESKAEKLYSKLETKKGGSGSDSGRTHPADSEKSDGRTVAERDARKSRPSAEVAARGGSPAPEEITVANNPAAWIAHRNQIRGGR